MSPHTGLADCLSILGGGYSRPIRLDGSRKLKPAQPTQRAMRCKACSPREHPQFSFSERVASSDADQLPITMQVVVALQSVLDSQSCNRGSPTRAAYRLLDAMLSPLGVVMSSILAGKRTVLSVFWRKIRSQLVSRSGTDGPDLPTTAANHMRPSSALDVKGQMGDILVFITHELKVPS
ncbi:hypothetical protein OPT61_g4132 [Boeremia exigua]|uniref:Uncharacterized protein n=1 Tax=Boeremia exigua TaxID=749465 RepID=A0ACC2IFB4_9PLEO|nr:hypothetical protein OPT61_g4132 [Boeremia exigua]